MYTGILICYYVKVWPCI